MESVDADGLKGILKRGAETGVDWDFIEGSVRRIGKIQRRLNSGSPTEKEVEAFLKRWKGKYPHALEKMEDDEQEYGTER